MEGIKPTDKTQTTTKKTQTTVWIYGRDLLCAQPCPRHFRDREIEDIASALELLTLERQT